MATLRPLALFWHNVLPDSISLEVQDGANPTASMFRSQIKFIVENYTPISIGDFIRIAETTDPPPSYVKPPVLLSFDDGFLNIVDQALPILNEFEVPATFFVLGQVLTNSDFIPWYVEMNHLVRRAEKRVIELGHMTLNLAVKEDVRKLKRLFGLSFRNCQSKPERQRMLTALAKQLGVGRPITSELDEDLRFVNKETLSKLESSSLLTVGSHAMTHYPLDSLSYEDQAYELEQSDLLLRKYCLSYCPVIAYPHAQFNADTIALAKRIYRMGFAVLLGASARNLYAYPRIGIGQDTVEHLAYAISPMRRHYILPLKRFLHRARLRRLS